MMKRSLLATTLLASAPAFGQGVNTNAQWTVGPQPVVYTSAHTIGDGSTPNGGLPPAFGYEHPDVPSAGTMGASTVASWTKGTGGGTGTVPFDAGDNKFRTHCLPAFEATFDPLLFPNQPGMGHEHTFLGNDAVNASSTYTTLRTTGGSTCAGGPLNRSAYWISSMKETRASGVQVTRKPLRMTVYYTVGTVADAEKHTRIMRDFGYVGGKNPSNFNNAARRAEVPVGYTYIEDEGFEGWNCEDGATAASSGKFPYLRDKDGNATFACEAGDYIVANLVAPPCWDGKNAKSPDAREHVRYRIRNNADGKLYCPDGWFQLPGFRGIIKYGPLEYNNQHVNWNLSSDRMNPANAPGDPTSLSPCRKVGPWFCNGETMHFDWWGGWDYGTAASPGIMLDWMKNCAGVTLHFSNAASQAGRPAACSDSAVKDNVMLLTNGDAPPVSGYSLNPVMDFGDPPLAQRYFPVRPGSQSDIKVKHDHTENLTPIKGAILSAYDLAG